MKLKVNQLNITAREGLLRQQVKQLIELTPAQEIIHSIPIVGEIKITIQGFRLLNLKTRDDGLHLQLSFNVDGSPTRRMRKMRVKGSLELEGKIYVADKEGWLEAVQFDLIDIRWIDINLKDVKWAIEKVTNVLESKVETQINEKIDELTSKTTIVEQLKGIVRPIPVSQDFAMDLRSAVIRLQDLVFKNEGVGVSLGLEADLSKVEGGSSEAQETDIHLLDSRSVEHHHSSVFISVGEINELLELSLPQVNAMIPVEQVQIERLIASCPAPQRLQIEVFTTQLKRPLVTRFHIWLDDKRQMLELLDFDLSSHSDASIITKGLVKIFREKVEEKVQSIFPVEISNWIPKLLATAEERVGHMVDFDKVDLKVSELAITEEGLQLDFVSDLALSVRSIEST